MGKSIIIKCAKIQLFFSNMLQCHSTNRMVLQYVVKHSLLSFLSYHSVRFKPPLSSLLSFFPLSSLLSPLSFLFSLISYELRSTIHPSLFSHASRIFFFFFFFGGLRSAFPVVVGPRLMAACIGVPFLHTSEATTSNL